MFMKTVSFTIIQVKRPHLQSYYGVQKWPPLFINNLILIYVKDHYGVHKWPHSHPCKRPHLLMAYINDLTLIHVKRPYLLMAYINDLTYPDPCTDWAVLSFHHHHPHLCCRWLFLMQMMSHLAYSPHCFFFSPTRTSWSDRHCVSWRESCSSNSNKHTWSNCTVLKPKRC